MKIELPENEDGLNAILHAVLTEHSRLTQVGIDYPTEVPDERLANKLNALSQVWSAIQRAVDELKARINVGDRVAFRAKYLHDTVQHTGEVPQKRGVVTAVAPVPGMPEQTLAMVVWDGKDDRKHRTQRVNAAHLVREDRLHLDRVS